MHDHASKMELGDKETVATRMVLKVLDTWISSEITIPMIT